MKSTKLAKSELVKLFMRPAIYFLTGFLVVALILVSIIYNPTPRENNQVDLYSMISMCMQAIKEQQEIIEKLEKRIEDLENEIFKNNQWYFDVHSFNIMHFFFNKN